MSRKDTNAIFFQMDLLDDPNGFSGYNTISRSIENRYKTLCYCLDYSLEERINLARIEGKKFGFVLKSLK